MMDFASRLPALRQWPVLLLLGLCPGAISQGDDKKTPSAADYYVQNLPGLPKDEVPIKMHAGHIEVDSETNANMFFWHFENQHIGDKQRTVIWLNGGPGCSSEDGALMEVGPYRVKEDGNLRRNNGSWNEFANLLFVDNPVGTGFSYVDTDSFLHELDEMADQFIKFLENFFKVFPEYEKDEIFIAGESYAGQHIPYISRAILDRNKKGNHEPWNLAGLLIGNGWISPHDQYEAYLTYARQEGLVEKGSEIDKQLEGMVRTCKKLMGNDPEHVDYGDCEDILNTMLKLLQNGNGKDACINMYDIRKTDEYPSCGMNWPPDLEFITPYLRKDEVIKELHIDPQRNTGWSECSGSVSMAFTTKKSLPAVKLLPDLIKEVPILLFSGQKDLICNHHGTEELIKNLEWNGGKGFETSPGNWAPRRNWTFEGDDAGFWQEARNLTYVLFNEASHMVPFDFPRRSRDMLDRFMGIDISSIGGEPADSRLDGEKGPDTAVGDVDQDEPSDEETQKEIDDAKWTAYRRSGEVVLVIVAIAASGWGYFIWRERRKRAAYHAITGDEPYGDNAMNGLRRKDGPGDLEAGAFDERELDDLHVETPTGPSGHKYSIGDDSEDDEGEEKSKGKHA